MEGDGEQVKVKVTDDVPEWHLWTRLPNVVLDKVDDPHELALLFVIRKVAGDDSEDGVCYMSLRTLARVAKMGKSTVAKKIKSLSAKGLIQTEFREAPRKAKGQGQSQGQWKVWWIRIPRSIWEENELAYRKYLEGRKLSTTRTNKTKELNLSTRRTKTVHHVRPKKNHKKNTSLKRGERNPPTPQKKRDPRLDHPALNIYRSVARLTAPHAVRDDLIHLFEEIGEEVYEGAIKSWIGRGWNPKNVVGIIDFARKGEKGEAHLRVLGKPGVSQAQRQYYSAHLDPKN